MMAQFAFHICGYNFCITVADAVHTSHNCLSPVPPDQVGGHSRTQRSHI
jgi:hypothetical protein